MNSQHEVFYRGVVAGSYFGRLLQPGQSFWTSASHAIELHTDGSGRWICPKIDQAKAELANPDPETKVVEVAEKVSIDGAEDKVVVRPEFGSELGDGAKEKVVLPPLDSSAALQQTDLLGSEPAHKCTVCGEPFTSKRKLTAHVSTAHSVGS